MDIIVAVGQLCCPHCGHRVPMTATVLRRSPRPGGALVPIGAETLRPLTDHVREQHPKRRRR